MKEFSLEQTVQAVHGTFCGDSALLSRNVRGVVIDNRRVEPDSPQSISGQTPGLRMPQTRSVPSPKEETFAPMASTPRMVA